MYQWAGHQAPHQQGESHERLAALAVVGELQVGQVGGEAQSVGQLVYQYAGAHQQQVLGLPVAEGNINHARYQHAERHGHQAMVESETTDSLPAQETAKGQGHDTHDTHHEAKLLGRQAHTAIAEGVYQEQDAHLAHHSLRKGVEKQEEHAAVPAALFLWQGGGVISLIRTTCAGQCPDVPEEEQHEEARQEIEQHAPGVEHVVAVEYLQVACQHQQHTLAHDQGEFTEQFLDNGVMRG